ncbi:hypothetical protein ABZP36_011095 [Zizania latifolia]
MSPPRTARSADAAPCHQKGWLSVVSRPRVCACGKKERRRCDGRKAAGSGGAGTLLSVPDDMLGAIFASGSLTAADVVCSAATFREWGRVVASRSEYISRGLPPLGRYHSDLAVGIFTAPITRMRKPHFIPTAAGARLLGDRRIFLLDGFQVDITGVASISSQKMRQIFPAVLRHGVAFWPLDDGALRVHLDLERPESMDVQLLPFYSPCYWLYNQLLGVSPDKRLFVIRFGMWQGFLSGILSYFDIDGDDISTGRKNSELGKEVLYPMFDMKMESHGNQLFTLKLRWFYEKSGLILFTLGESSEYPRAFALDVQSPAVEKVLSGPSVSWRSIHLESPTVVKVTDGHS